MNGQHTVLLEDHEGQHTVYWRTIKDQHTLLLEDHKRLTYNFIGGP